MSRLPASIAVAGPTATAPAVAPPVEIAAPAIEVPAPAAALPIVDAEPMVVHRVTAREPAALSPAAAAAAATTVATVEQAAPRATGCDGDDACIDGRLEVAEREIAVAYADATDAGVRAKILRGYRNEWLRTRQEVDDRPREALRLYAMMTSDLRNLSEDAAGAGRPDWR